MKKSGRDLCDVYSEETLRKVTAVYAPRTFQGLAERGEQPPPAQLTGCTARTVTYLLSELHVDNLLWLTHVRPLLLSQPLVTAELMQQAGTTAEELEQARQSLLTWKPGTDLEPPAPLASLVENQRALTLLFGLGDTLDLTNAVYTVLKGILQNGETRDLLPGLQFFNLVAVVFDRWLHGRLAIFTRLLLPLLHARLGSVREETVRIIDNVIADDGTLDALHSYLLTRYPKLDLDTDTATLFARYCRSYSKDSQAVQSSLQQRLCRTLEGPATLSDDDELPALGASSVWNEVSSCFARKSKKEFLACRVTTWTEARALLLNSSSSPFQLLAGAVVIIDYFVSDPARFCPHFVRLGVLDKLANSLSANSKVRSIRNAVLVLVKAVWSMVDADQCNYFRVNSLFRQLACSPLQGEDEEPSWVNNKFLSVRRVTDVHAGRVLVKLKPGGADHPPPVCNPPLSWKEAMFLARVISYPLIHEEGADFECCWQCSLITDLTTVFSKQFHCEEARARSFLVWLLGEPVHVQKNRVEGGVEGSKVKEKKGKEREKEVETRQEKSVVKERVKEREREQEKGPVSVRKHESPLKARAGKRPKLESGVELPDGALEYVRFWWTKSLSFSEITALVQACGPDLRAALTSSGHVNCLEGYQRMLTAGLHDECSSDRVILPIVYRLSEMGPLGFNSLHAILCSALGQSQVPDVRHTTVVIDSELTVLGRPQTLLWCNDIGRLYNEAVLEVLPLRASCQNNEEAQKEMQPDHWCTAVEDYVGSVACFYDTPTCIQIGLEMAHIDSQCRQRAMFGKRIDNSEDEDNNEEGVEDGGQPGFGSDQQDLANDGSIAVGNSHNVAEKGTLDINELHITYDCRERNRHGSAFPCAQCRVVCGSIRGGELCDRCGLWVCLKCAFGKDKCQFCPSDDDASLPSPGGVNWAQLLHTCKNPFSFLRVWDYQAEEHAGDDVLKYQLPGPAPQRVLLQAHVLLAMCAWSFDTGRYEVVGDYFSPDPTAKDLVIEQFMPLDNVSVEYDSFDVEPEQKQKVYELMRDGPKLVGAGTFHSHPASTRLLPTVEDAGGHLYPLPLGIIVHAGTSTLLRGAGSFAEVMKRLCDRVLLIHIPKESDGAYSIFPRQLPGVVRWTSPADAVERARAVFDVFEQKVPLASGVELGVRAKRLAVARRWLDKVMGKA